MTAFKIYQFYIIKHKFSEGVKADTYWVSNLSAEVDEENKHIKLKASSDFFRKYIEERYQHMIQMAAKIFGFEITLLL